MKKISVKIFAYVMSTILIFSSVIASDRQIAYAAGEEMAIDASLEIVALIMELVEAAFVSVGVTDLSFDELSVLTKEYGNGLAQMPDWWNDAMDDLINNNPDIDNWDFGETWHAADDYGFRIYNPITKQWEDHYIDDPSDFLKDWIDGDDNYYPTEAEKEKWGLTKDAYPSKKAAIEEYWRRTHPEDFENENTGGGSGDGSGGGSGDPADGSSNPVSVVAQIGAGALAGLGFFAYSVINGLTHNDEIEEIFPESVVDTSLLPYDPADCHYYGDGAPSSFIYHFYSDDGVNTIIQDVNSELPSNCGRVAIGQLRGENSITHQVFYMSSIYYYDTVRNEVKYWNKSFPATIITNSTGRSTTGNRSIPAQWECCGSVLKANVPIFRYEGSYNSTTDSIGVYLRGGSDEDCINKEEKPLFFFPTVKSNWGSLGGTLSHLSNLPSDKAVSADTLKQYNNSMKKYAKSDTASPSNYTDVASQTMANTVTQTAVSLSPSSGTQTGTEPNPSAKPTYLPFVPPADLTAVDIEGSEVTRDWHLVFPFCIPFDIIHLFGTLNAEPVAPRWEIPLSLPAYGIEYTFVIDLAEFESVAEVFRICELILFILLLCILTSKVIKW